VAHSPEQPDLYVCDDCQTVHAGTVVGHADSGHTYEAPDGCGACAASAFTRLVDWPRRHD
jgi:hypothetical protein